MRFERIPAERFVEFHTSFLGDTLATFEVCSHCGGACEYNKIVTLVPGEREYMAGAAGLSVGEFSERYLDILVMEDGMELDVLRLINGCPFLDWKTYECKCREYKVVLCEIYPIGFQVREGEVEFEIDDWCPLSDTLPFRHYFQQVGVSAMRELQVPVAWYEQVARYDDLYFDYEALQACERDPAKPQVFTLEELLSFQRSGQEHPPKERFHPYPSKVYPGLSGAGPKNITTGRRPLLPVLRGK
jgi:uncharacterized protein